MSSTNIVVLLAVGAFILFGYFNQADRDALGQVVSEGTMDVFAVKVGDCTNDAEDASEDEMEILNDVLAIPCSEPHDNEFYSAFDIEDESYPGDDAISEYSDALCEERFEPFVGIDYYDSVLEISYIYPTEESWADNDREVICFLYHMEFEKLQGSMQDSKI